MNDPRIAMNNDNLTNEQAGAISRAHSNLKAAFNVLNMPKYMYLTAPKNQVEEVHKDVEYAIEDLEEAFTWLNVYHTPKRKDKR